MSYTSHSAVLLCHTLLLRRAVRVEVVELAAGEHAAAPLSGGADRAGHLCQTRGVEAVAARRERHHAAVQGIEADRALLHACAAMTAEVVQTFSEALIDDVNRGGRA